MKLRMITTMSAAVALAVLPAAAGSADLVPSCYAAVQIGIAAPAPRRALFVLVDQTTPASPELSELMRREATANAQAGTRLMVGSFSAAEGGQFVRVNASGTIESAVPGALRNSLSVPRLAQLDQCLAQQRGFGARKFDQAIEAASRPGRASFDHSEIMRSLAQLSQRVAATPAADRIVIIYSDMIEHSDATSFYQAHNLRLIDPPAEIAKARARGQLGNFAGARVYVVGGGLLMSGPIRDSRARDALRAFWARWFAMSNARLVEFGAPALMNAVR